MEQIRNSLELNTKNILNDKVYSFKSSILNEFDETCDTLFINKNPKDLGKLKNFRIFQFLSYRD